MRSLADIGRDIAAQDNRMTSLPIFIVQVKKRIYGLDYDFHEDAKGVWLDGDGNEVPDKDAEEYEKQYKESGRIRVGNDFVRALYIDIWETVMPFFTEVGAKAYIACNGRNLREPRIYVESGYRNKEWEDVRDHLMALGQEVGK